MTSEKIIIRLAGTADVDAIFQLTQKAYAKWKLVLDREPTPMTANYKKAVNDHRFDLMYLGQGLIGLIETFDRDDHLFIENLAIDPDHQGMGYGRKLLNLATDIALAKGYKSIKLATNIQMRENIALYKKFGYEVEEEFNFKGGKAVYMRLRLMA